uniref:Uncharacterized protein n=1 Tax=Tanacetum cinerariifolium TaxID=118510 RepID=A0A6L2N4H3_TANCI|nr:hypothetical protein [Tanacetum cinerariifolium]
METDEVSEWYIAPCFVNGLDAYDGEINLAFDENLISNEYAVKLCLDYEVKKENKIVKKELIFALRGELYLVKFIINLKEDEGEHGVILGRSFIRLVNGIVDFSSEDQLLDFNFDDIPQLDGEGLSQFVCKMGKSSHNKKRAMENLNLFYQDIKPSSPVLETMAYNDKYKKVLDDIWKDKVELDGMIAEEKEEAIEKVKGEALKEKDDTEAFIFPIRLEGKSNETALADTGPDINTMPYRIYEQLGREEIKKVDRRITMINHTQTEAMGILMNVLCQSNSDDEEEYEIKKNKFGAPIYDPKLTAYLNCNNPAERSLALQAVINPFRKISVWKKAFRPGGRAHSLTLLEFARRLGLYHADELDEEGFDVYFQGRMRSDEHFNAQEYWLSINRENNLSLSRSHASAIKYPVLRVVHKMITYGLCQRKNRKRVFSDEVIRSLSALIYCRDLDTTTLRESIDSEGRLIPEDPQPGVSRVAILRPLRESMQDLWKPTSRIFKTAGLRWVPIGKLFESCMSKTDSESSHVSNVDISKIHEYKETLDLSVGTSINVQKEQSFDLHVEVPTIDMIVITSMVELESLFGPLFAEYFNRENQVVSKSFTVTTADASDKRQKQQPDSTSSTLIIATIVTADENFDL